MLLVGTTRELSIEVIDEYLTAAKMCIDKQKPDGGILGYPAVLLLLCATDAIGHGVLRAKPRGSSHTWLHVLTQWPFDLKLDGKQIKNLKDWYRDKLAHSGLIVPGVYLKPETHGDPFYFDTSGALTLIRVPVLYETVRSAWERLDKTAFKPPSPHPNGLPSQSAQQPGFGSTISSASSGRI